MNRSKTKQTHLEDFIHEVQAVGRLAFSWEELLQRLNTSQKALHQALYRWKEKGKIAQVRRGFYVIIPPTYATRGMIPPQLFIDDLMKSLGKRYYVGLFSAAALHGAAHQVPLEFYVVTEKPALRNIRNDKLTINFFVKKDWHEEDITRKKTDAGYMQVASPEMTALDLLRYGPYSINRIYTILEELVETMKARSLTQTARNYPHLAPVQRLGYLLERELGNEKLARALGSAIRNKKLHPVPLLKGGGNKGTLDKEWQVLVNTSVESER